MRRGRRRRIVRWRGLQHTPTHAILSVSLAERHALIRSLMPDGARREEKAGKIKFDFHEGAFRSFVGGGGDWRD